MDKKLEILVLSVIQANKFIPDKPSAAIRIWNSDQNKNDSYRVLKPSKNWLSIKDYVFDDIDDVNYRELEELSKSTEDEDLYYKYFTRNLGNKIITDFVEVKDKIELLMVHCTAGMSRSPAIALALNEMFNLGQDSKEMIFEYKSLNYPVYQLMFFSQNLTPKF